jgi:hypothetical protein
MNRLNVIHSTRSMATVSIATLARRALLLDTRADATFTMADTASTAVTSSNRIGSSRTSSNRARPWLWLRAQSAASIDEIMVTPPTPYKPAIDGANARETPQIAAAVQRPEPGADPDATPVADTPKKSSGAEKIELAIDTLPNYELVKPIPVSIESLGDKIFVAEVPGMDISITGTSVGGVLLQLKEHITSLYEGHRLKKNLDAERTRQLKMLETYIGKARRNWF